MAFEIIDSLMVKIALIGALGIGAQWVAWRTGRPAIALMLIVGIIAGPVLGIIRPENDFGALLDPIVKLAVAVILFEGGLSLNFKDLRVAGWAVSRLVFIGVPVGWALGTAAAYYIAGLSLPVAALFGGILVVTGPTVIGPMLRNLRVGARVRDTLKWEGIVNDPIGALLAVGIYAYITYDKGGAMANVAFDVLGASFLAGLIGGALGYGMTWLFPRGYVPEYLKAPILLIVVILGFVLADLIMHETGLITVTIMGVVMANREYYSSRALHRFKEDLSVLLISGVFILLSAQLDWATVEKFQIQFILFLLVLLFVVRPLTVWTSLLFSSVPWREQVFIGWIAPRGIVAVAITGLFAKRLVNSGYEDAEALVALSFGVVIATIFAHGFSARWVAQRLGIEEGDGKGVMLVGANRWTLELGAFLKSLEIPVTISDTSYFALRGARQRELDIHNGDILDEALDDMVDLGAYQHLIVATDNDSYNQLLSSDLGPEVGYDHISAVSVDSTADGNGERSSRGRILLENATSYGNLVDRARDGWVFSRTRLTEKFTYEDFRENLEEDEEPVAILKPNQKLLFFSAQARPVIELGDQIISFIKPDSPEERKASREQDKPPQS
ncbi:cation:proton antiporter [Alterisphingorhabdus coralli]|uniref:Sodium:proton antiporter n=1 Tax=Alterisphingorhabdus coralli TaxID=3071408 RepID=A0AA97I167_9SPHN|nr:sodium:proton antiporter [Parasphingorhabdus sp. SCSIO 66989]WOE75063.1 sodium:proton antiporter [Parasphingorhabdus sp. SCSIO 66989]